jgi:hypothetical protein
MHTKFWLENMKGRDHLEDVGIDDRISEWIPGKYNGKVLGTFDSRYRLVAGS